MGDCSLVARWRCYRRYFPSKLVSLWHIVSSRLLLPLLQLLSPTCDSIPPSLARRERHVIRHADKRDTKAVDL